MPNEYQDKIKTEVVSQLTGFNSTLQNVDQSYEWINDMIRYRQQIMLLFMQLVNREMHFNPLGELYGPDSIGADDAVYNPAFFKLLREFCDSIVDYLSCGHFQIYPKIFAIQEQASSRSASISRRAYAHVCATTDKLMAFDHDFSEGFSEDRADEFRKALSEVGASLEYRFRMEDRMIVGLRLVGKQDLSANLPSQHQAALAEAAKNKVYEDQSSSVIWRGDNTSLMEL